MLVEINTSDKGPNSTDPGTDKALSSVVVAALDETGYIYVKYNNTFYLTTDITAPE